MELSLEDLQDIVNIRCMEIGEQPLTIFNNDCPICSEGITNNNYKILHPCAHILCNNCTIQIAPINMSIRIPCPICRKPSKWIDSLNNNLRQVSRITNNTIFDLNNLPPLPMTRVRTIGMSHGNNFNRNNFNRNNFNNNLNNFNDDDLIVYESLISKPPLSVETFINQNNIIKAGYSKILYKEKYIGSLTINSNNENVSNEKDLIFLIDNSGSMDRTIDKIKENLNNLISNLTPKDRLTVIFFDTNAKQLFTLQPMTATIKEQVNQIIMDEPLGATTNYKSAFLLLKKVMVEGYIPGRQMIVIFGSDGIPDTSFEGVEEIQNLYNTDMIFQIYSCSFGGSVSATVLQSVLKSNNQENYRHFVEANQFQYFIKNDLECDNPIIASNVKIICKNVIPLSSQTTSREQPNEYEININILKSIDFVSCPLEFIDPDNFEILIIYKNTNNENLELECLELPMDNNFIIYTYNYKNIIKKINDLNENIDIANNLKVIELENIKNILNIVDYGNFLSEITNFLNKSIQCLSETNSNYNEYNNLRQYTSNNVSCRSSSIGVVYPVMETDDDISDDIINENNNENNNYISNETK